MNKGAAWLWAVVVATRLVVASAADCPRPCKSYAMYYGKSDKNVCLDTNDKCGSTNTAGCKLKCVQIFPTASPTASPTAACKDYRSVLTGSTWNDGHSYGCANYQKNKWCNDSRYTCSRGTDNKTALQACCVCKGVTQSSKACSASPSAAPSSSPTQSPSAAPSSSPTSAAPTTAAPTTAAPWAKRATRARVTPPS